MTKLYNIKNNDMLYFLLFSVVLIPFQFIADVFTLSAPTRRPAVLRCLHAIDATRVIQTMSVVVSFSSLRPFGPSRENAMLRAGPRALPRLEDLRLSYLYALSLLAARNAVEGPRGLAGRVHRRVRADAGPDVLLVAVLHDDDGAGQ